MSLKLGLPTVFGLILLAACGGGDAPAASDAGTEMLANGMTVKAQIEARQEGFKAIGKNFKTINDQLKTDAPDLAAIEEAVGVMVDTGAGIGDWFPEGTGPESGVETDALPAIWENRDDFDTKAMDAQAALAAFKTAVETGDVATISAAVRTTGGTCKACHDEYRAED